MIPDIDSLFRKFFASAEILFFYVPLNPCRLFRNPLTPRARNISIFFYYFVIFSQLLLAFLYGAFIIDSMVNDEDGEFLITVATFDWFLLVIVACHCVYFTRNEQPEIFEIMELLYEFFPKTADGKARFGADEWAKNWTAKMKVQTIVFVLAVLGMVLLPICSSLFIYITDGVWTNQLPLVLWLPFDPLVWPIYPLVYAVEIWFFLINTVVIVAIEAILGAITILICMQFNNVSSTLRSIKFGNYKDDLRAIGQVMEYHNSILSISAKTRKVFSYSMLYTFTISSMVICVFMFLILNEERQFAKLQYTTNLICFLVYCSVYGYYGNVIIEYSTSVADAAYESNWIEADVRIKKLIILIIRRASQPETLTGQGFFVASFPTFSKILTSSYSYFTLLKTSYKRGG